MKVAILVALTALVIAQDSGPAGVIRVGIARGNSYDVVSMPLETYVARVLAGEAAPGSAPAALEALAITVRTFALANQGRHRADGFDLCDQTHCQVLRTPTPATERAAQATAGQVLLYNGIPASVFYSASCGGHSELPSAVWPGADDPPYLPSREDDACGGEPSWTAEVDASDVQRTLASAGFRGRLRDMRVVSRDSSGRVARLGLDGLTPSEISGPDWRAAAGQSLGWLLIKSTAFDLRREGTGYRFTGHGFGHGVGLCVIGSVKLAAAGESGAAILRRYFPGAVISSGAPRVTSAAPPAATPRDAIVSLPQDVIVSLPQGEEGERDAIVSLASRARDDLSGILGVPAPARMTLRFHSTTADYERATGTPWFTSAVVVRSEVHLVPLASLRDRGVLERTLRRQLVHVMTDSVLEGKPAWVREGAALFFSDRDESDPGTRVSCPSDAELLAPPSIGALSDAYARARRCFARQIASGRSWREVR